MSLLPTVNELLLIVYIILWVALVILVSELLRKKNVLSTYSSRKIVHISIIVPVILAYVMVDRPLYPIIVTGLALLFNYFTAPVSPIKKLRLKVFSEGHAWGTVLFSFSVFLIFLFFYSMPYLGVIVGSALCFGDGFSGLLGKKYGKTRPTLLKGKSVEGSIIFFLSSFIGVILIYPLIIVPHSFSFLLNVNYLLVAGISLLVGTIVEVFSPGGFDNVIVPVLTGVTAYLVYIALF